MDYQAVRHSHVVPAGYLRTWAVNGRLEMTRVGGSEPRLIGVRDAGVKRDFYRRERPTTGKAIYDIEWTLQQAETAALPLLNKLPELWPLDDEARGHLGQFLALQHLRGAGFERWHRRHVEDEAQRLESDPQRYGKASAELTAEEAVARAVAHLRSSTYRLTMMLRLVRSVGIVFGSMHASLVEFRKDLLLTSDHPVVVWPSRRGRARPMANELNAGVADTIEVFAPVGPRYLLLLSWLPDATAAAPVRGLGRHAATANAFVLANAVDQWFLKPGIRPPIARGVRVPLSSELVGRYDPLHAKAVERRVRAQALANAEREKPLSNDPVAILVVRERQGGAAAR